MAILKYYKVDADGKIKRLRRECPSAECGAGVFMVRHLTTPSLDPLLILIPSFLVDAPQCVSFSASQTYDDDTDQRPLLLQTDSTVESVD